MSIEIQPYFAEGERYPALIGVRAEGDEHETAYVSKSELVDALAENAKLRKELEYVGTAAYLYGRSDLKADNAKLRELVQDYERCTMHADCARCEYDGKLSTHCPFSPCFPDIDELRDLGVEVDE